MFKHECYKIFSRKSIYIVLLLMILTIVYANSLPNDMTMKEDIYEDLLETWGGPITEEKVAIAREQMSLSDSGEKSTYTSEDRATGLVHNLYVVAAMNTELLNDRKETLHNKKGTLSVNSYAYKEAEKEFSMLKKLGEPHAFYLTGGWRGMFDFIEPAITAIFLSILILLGVTPVFANEYANRTVGLVLATKHGKRKVVTAKMMAISTYIFVVLISLHVANSGLQLIKFGGLQGWNAPIQNLSGWLDSLSMINYEQSTYAFEIWQLYILTFSLQFVASLTFAILVVLISIILKNAMYTILVSGALLGAPYILGQFSTGKGILAYINTFNYGEFMKSASLFQEYKAYNILGYPVLYPHLLVGVFILITTILIILIYNQFQHTKRYF